MIRKICIVLMVITAIIPFVFAADTNVTNSSDYKIIINSSVPWSGEYGLIGGDIISVSSESGKSEFAVREIPKGKTLKVNFRKVSDFKINGFVLYPTDKSLNVSVLKGDTVVKYGETGDYSGVVALYINT